MKALEATIRIRLRPEVIGPEATTEWTGPLAEASASDYLGDLLGREHETILDWGYVDSPGVLHVWHEAESPSSDEYEEGEMFAERNATIAALRAKQ